jgi:type I restriction enzyme, S subunit
MSLVRYRDYRHSGVEWLGLVPKHWDVKRLKYLCTIQTGDKDTVNAIDDGKYPFFVRSQSAERIGTYTFDCEAVLTAGDGAGVGKVFHYVNGKFDFHQRVYMMNEFRFVSGKFFYWYLSSLFAVVALEGGAKSTVDSLRMPVIMNFPFIVPPLDEQRAIVAFVDTEASKIDALIAEQRRLIVLLNEKRQAVISRAVTKGLNPLTPMTDTGIDWLGTVPTTWLALARRLGKLFRGQKRQGFSDRDVLSVYRDYGVILKDSRDDNFNKTPEDVSLYQLVQPGDLVVNKMKAWQGSLGISDLEGITSPDYVVFAPTHNESSEYLHNLLRCQPMVSVYRSISNGIRPAQWRLEPDKFLSLTIFLPPLSEQQTIVDFIRKEASGIDALIAEAERATALLVERRTALISAAVTGKIDVRRFEGASATPKRVAVA